jgi:nucleoside-diphosphate-sugar epimerase
MGKRILPLFQPDLPGEAEATLADITEAKRLGWTSKTDIRTGLLRAIDFIQSEKLKGKIR